MRRFLPLALPLAVAACSSTPKPEPVRPVTVAAPRPTGQLIGLGENDLVARFGSPTFQVREGTSLKLQWANATCVLDAYLYPVESGHSGPRTSHVDARKPNGADMDYNLCAVALAR